MTYEICSPKLPHLPYHLWSFEPTPYPEAIMKLPVNYVGYQEMGIKEREFEGEAEEVTGSHAPLLSDHDRVAYFLVLKVNRLFIQVLN